MFSIGDKVVYAMHGAGTVKAIEEKKILGEVRSYYILHISHGNMEIMVPTEGDSAGLRPIVSEDVIPRVEDVLSSESTPMEDNWNRRNRENMEKLKTGDLCQVAEVIRNLVRVDRGKKLSTGEKKLLTSAKHILSSEMTMVLSISEDKALDIIDSSI